MKPIKFLLITLLTSSTCSSFANNMIESGTNENQKSTNALEAKEIKKEKINFNYHFNDCNGNTFSTIELMTKKQSKDYVDCAFKGMINTKFDSNGTVEGIKSIPEMTPKELEVFKFSSVNNPRAQFTLGVYDYFSSNKAATKVEE